MSWEYRTQTVRTKGGFLRQIRPDADLEDTCNQAGREGWELVSALPLSETQGRTASICLLFKRPR